MTKSVEVPELDHDAMMLQRFGHKVSPNGRLERRIVANLFAHMLAAGWRPYAVDDGEEVTKVADAKAAMELIFDLDEVRVVFANAEGAKHTVLLVLGNGIDIITDWGFSEGDADGFNAAMDAFDAEQFA